MQAARIREMLMAAIIADAFGVPAEGQQRGTYQLTQMIGGGIWRQPIGSWSDDTSMSLALMAHLTAGDTYGDLMVRFANYIFKGDYTPNQEAFGVGRTCRQAVRNYFYTQVPATAAGSNQVNSNGNGALMRLAPLAIVLADESQLSKRLKLAHDYTCLTHRHPRSILASYFYLEILHVLLTGSTLQAALQVVPTQLKDALAKQKEILAEWSNFDFVWRPKFKRTPRAAIKSTAYVVDTLAAAIWVNLNSTDLTQTIELAANLGGDTDTIATISASLFMAGHPHALVPADWYQCLCHVEVAERIVGPFAKQFAS